MVGQDFQGDDIGSILQSSLTHDFLKPFGDVADKNFAAILRRPHAMILAAVYDVVVRLVPFECHTRTIPDVAVYCQEQKQRQDLAYTV